MAQKQRRILVAVDEGQESMYALSWCIKNLIFQNSEDTLILLYVKKPPVVYSAFDGSGYLFSTEITATMDRYSRQAADMVLEKAKKLCNKIQNVEARVESGDPRDAICEMAEKLDVDVLVMGSHGYGLIKRALLGSVSSYCAQKAKCPVLIVKKPKSTVEDL